MSEQPSYAIGIDIGATKIAALLANRSGRILLEENTSTLVEQGPDALVERIAQVAGSLIPRAQGRLDGIGIGSPGLVDAEHGIVRTAVNLGRQEVPLAARLKTLLGDSYPIQVGNDTNTQILGEYYFGAARTLGRVCSFVVAVLNPAVIVIGGGAGLAAFDLLVPPARLELRRRVLPQTYARLDILPSRVDSSAMGAACLVWHAQRKE